MAPLRQLAAPLALLALAVTTSTAKLEARSSTQHSSLAARKPSRSFESKWLASNFKDGDAAPDAKSGDASGQTIVLVGKGGQDVQVDSCPTAFVGTAAVEGSPDDGWKALPQVTGFDLDRSLVIDGAKMPVYIENTKDLTKVKRVVIGQPGKSRDSWKYANFFRNALVCAVSRDDLDVKLSDVLVVSPFWLTDDDLKAGAAASDELYFKNSGWANGAQSQGPGSTSVSSFKVMDSLIDKFMDRTQYPAVTSIVVGGHSLGATFTQRYAMIRRPNADQDPMISYWAANSGAYTWPGKERPIASPKDTSCEAEKDAFAYGVGSDLPAYRKNDNSATPENIYATYASRSVQIALGTADNDLGDSHCEAQYQGTSHYSRGQNLQKALEALPGGMPKTHDFNLVQGVTHQDYQMMADKQSQRYLYVKDLDATRTSSGAAASSGTGSSKTTSGGAGAAATGSNGSSSSSASGAASGNAASKVTALLGAAAIAIVGFAI